MNDRPAAIAGALVDVRNINTHKVVRLSIEVPAELAGTVLQAFGWPTGVDPIPVAIARLTDVPEAPPKALEGPRSYAQQAGILANEKPFIRFLSERGLFPAGDAEDAAKAIRELCGVKSRRELIEGTPAGNKWRDLKAEYEAWKIAA